MKMSPVDAMKLAITEAKKGAGFVSPNPLVGCVILDKNQNLLSVGYHARLGEAHAEINALNTVKDPSQLEGAHLFVTLEPCAHQGRTPPCADRLSALPFASVTYGLEDPNPKVAGKGLAVLRKAGIDVRTLPELRDELEDLAEIFLMNMREKRAFVALKVATSLDGQMALKNGESQWITGEESRAHVQTLRGHYDAVAVGVGTFLADNPRLNSRDPKFASKTQKAVVIDPEGKSLSRLTQSAMWRVRAPGDIVLVTSESLTIPKALEACPKIRLKLADGSIDWRELLEKLYAIGIASILVEGGARTFAGVISQKMADRIYVYVAPQVLGDGLSWTKDLQIPALKNAVQFHRTSWQNFGRDVLFSGRFFSK